MSGFIAILRSGSPQNVSVVAHPTKRRIVETTMHGESLVMGALSGMLESLTDVMRTVSRCCYARPGRQRSPKGGRRHDIRGMRPAHAHAAGGRAGHGDWRGERAPTPTGRDGGGRILCRLAPAGDRRD